MIILLFAFMVWLLFPHFVTGMAFYPAFLITCGILVCGMLCLPQKCFKLSFLLIKDKKFPALLFPASVLFLGFGIIMLAVFGVFPHFTLYSVECIITTLYTLITAGYVLHADTIEPPLNKRVNTAMSCNLGGLLAFFAQYALHMTNGMQFSFRLIFIPIGLTAILCAYFYRIIPNKNNTLLIKTWEQSLVLACSIFLVANIQLDFSTPQSQEYKVYQRTNFRQVRILDDGRWIDGDDAYPDENGNGTVLRFDGWFHVSYYLESDS